MAHFKWTILYKTITIRKWLKIGVDTKSGKLSLVLEIFNIVICWLVFLHFGGCVVLSLAPRPNLKNMPEYFLGILFFNTKVRKKLRFWKWTWRRFINNHQKRLKSNIIDTLSLGYNKIIQSVYLKALLMPFTSHFIREKSLKVISTKQKWRWGIYFIYSGKYYEWKSDWNV